jgi:2-iminobutanoate/2-iminopropanoate deaminase
MQIQYNHKPGVPTLGPYTPSVEAGGFVYVSGQLGIDPQTGNVCNESIEAETRQVMQNVQEQLAIAGCTLNHIVKASIFVRDMGQYGAINEVYASFLEAGHYPARELVEVSRLPKDGNVEISVIAYKG